MTLKLDFKYKEGLRCVTMSSLLLWLEHESSFDKLSNMQFLKGAINAREKLIQELKKWEDV